MPAAQPVVGQPVAPVAGQAVAATNAVAEEGYLIIQNPLGGDGMVRVMDGFTQKARVLAWTNPGDKYRIRAQSPTKMRRTYLKDGKNVTYEDFFYKISDKEQWVFGLEQFIPFITTVLVMLLTDLLKGVCAGLLVAVVFIIRDNIKISFESMSEMVNGRPYFLIKLPQHVTFFNKGYLIRFLKSVTPGGKLIIDGTINKKVNRDVKDVIIDFMKHSKKKNIDVELIKLNINQ